MLEETGEGGKLALQQAGSEVVLEVKNFEAAEFTKKYVYRKNESKQGSLQKRTLSASFISQAEPLPSLL